MGKCVFVAGVHGAGKGYLASRLSEALSLPSYSCSEIIKEFLGSLPKDKKVQDITGNQDVLVSSADQIIGNQSVILDGHFCLTDTQGQIQPVPIETFEGLNVNVILMVTAPPQVIAQRLVDRDGVEHDVGHIQLMQDQEIQHAEIVSSKITAPILSCTSGDDLAQIVDFVEQNT